MFLHTSMLLHPSILHHLWYAPHVTTSDMRPTSRPVICVLHHLWYAPIVTTSDMRTTSPVLHALQHPCVALPSGPSGIPLYPAPTSVPLHQQTHRFFKFLSATLLATLAQSMPLLSTLLCKPCPSHSHFNVQWFFRVYLHSKGEK